MLNCACYEVFYISWEWVDWSIDVVASIGIATHDNCILSTLADFSYQVGWLFGAKFVIMLMFVEGLIYIWSSSKMSLRSKSYFGCTSSESMVDFVLILWLMRNLVLSNITSWVIWIFL